MNAAAGTPAIVHAPFPRYMAVASAVGAVGLIASVGTLAESFEPIFGPGWSLLVAALIDVLALSLIYWAVAAVRAGLSPFGPRLAAHACILASVVAQAVTGYQGLAGGMSGWTSAAAHCIGPAVLALALELIARHFIAAHRALLAPARAQEVLRVQIARAAAGLPVRLDECAAAVVEAARANVVDIRALAATISADDVRSAPAMRALVTAVWPTTDLLPLPAPGAAAADAAAGLQLGHDRSATQRAGASRRPVPDSPSAARPVKGPKRAALDVDDLVLPAQAVAQDLTRAGERVTRASLATGLRARGLPCSTDKAQALLPLLRAQQSA